MGWLHLVAGERPLARKFFFVFDIYIIFLAFFVFNQL